MSRKYIKIDEYGKEILEMSCCGILCGPWEGSEAKSQLPQ